MSISSKLQEQSEGEQNASETAEIYNENSSTTQTNQISSSIAQVANQTASSQPHEVDVSRGNIGTSGVETTGQRSCSTEPAHDSSCNDVKTSEIGRKKYKVRYEMNISLRSPSVIVLCLFSFKHASGEITHLFMKPFQIGTFYFL